MSEKFEPKSTKQILKEATLTGAAVFLAVAWPLVCPLITGLAAGACTPQPNTFAAEVIVGGITHASAFVVPFAISLLHNRDSIRANRAAKTKK